MREDWKMNSMIVLFSCILRKLRSKVCILVTHQIQFLQYATKIILLDKVIQEKLFTQSIIHI